jgi:hypothetical protein
VELNGAQTRAEVVIRTRDLQVDDQLRAAAPDGLREILDQWRVNGPIATETTLRSDPEDAETSLAVRTVARLDGVSIRHPLFPIPFEDLRGEITFDESGARATGVEARYGQARVSVDFDTRATDGGEEGTIVLTAVGADMDHSLRDILPERFRTAWDRRAPTGTVDLHLDRLRYTRSDPDGRRVWQVDGHVDMSDVAFRGAAEIDGMSGTLTVSGTLVDRLGGTVLSGDLKASAVDLFGRHLTDIETPWSYTLTAEGMGRFALDSVQGNACGGMLKAELELSFDTRQTAYNLSTTVHDMDIGSLLRSGSSGTAAGEEDVNLRGRVDAHLYLSGELGDPLAKRGGGRVEIYECHMHRLPIMLAILNVINLSPPYEDAFDVAEADFFIVGNQMQLKDIVLEGRVLTLVGSGSMSLPDRGLDLDLVYMSSDGWARVPMLTEFIERASRSWTELHITGPLHRPTVRAQPFRGVSEELKRLFQKKKPKKIQPANP